MNRLVPSCELVTIIYLCYAFDWFVLLTLVGFLIMCSLRMTCNSIVCYGCIKESLPRFMVLVLVAFPRVAECFDAFMMIQNQRHVHVLLAFA